MDDNGGPSLDAFPMNFRLTIAERVRAAAGVPAYMRRLRRIEDLEEALLMALDEIHQEARDETPTIEEAERAFRERADRLDLTLLNDLIDRHNRYYPIEANLPVDVRTKQVLQGGKAWRPKPLVTLESLMDRMRNAQREADEAP